MLELQCLFYLFGRALRIFVNRKESCKQIYDNNKNDYYNELIIMNNLDINLGYNEYYN